jgi:hypothetical protein
MKSIAIKNFLKSRGFSEVVPWQEYKHENGMRVVVGEHEWAVITSDESSENGSLSEIGTLIRLVETGMR